MLQFWKMYPPIDLSAIQQKSLDRALLLYIFICEVRLSALELLSLLYTFENSTKCDEISFDLDFFSNS